MELTTHSFDDAIEIRVSGRLDAYWADPLAHAIEEQVRGGSHRLRLDLSGVSYISSVGIRVLLKFYKQLHGIGGALTICNPSEAVKTILELAGLQALLAARPAAAPAPTAAARRVEIGGIAFEVHDCAPSSRLRARAIGSPQQLATAGYQSGDCRAVRLEPSTFGVGLGAFGNSFDDCSDRFGEMLVAAGAATYLPTDGSNVPDYLVTAQAYVPEVQTLYALLFEGEPARLARFDLGTEGHAVTLSQLAQAALELSESDTIGLIALAESAGLIGAGLRQSPSRSAAPDGLFHHPEVRSWLSFSPERCHARSLALVVGVASRAPSSALAPFVRPMTRDGRLHGHFHAAAFSYRPLAKGALELRSTVAGLFETEALQGVLHLLSDDREHDATGESELVRGACWFGPIAEVGGE